MSELGDVELRELRIFLALAEELHFGHTAERLGVSQSVVSEAIRALERRLRVRLFERTSRRVEPTASGVELAAKLRPQLEALERTLGEVRDAAAGGVAGVLRLAVTESTFLPPVVRLAEAFEGLHPECKVSLGRADYIDLYGPLRRGRTDVLVNWLAVDEPDLTVGPAIAHYDRVLLVAAGHRLAERESVSVEDLADEAVINTGGVLPPALEEAVVPRRTPSGRVIPSSHVVHNLATDIISAVLLGKLVHPTMRGVTIFERDDVALVPIHDLPPLPLGLIWRTAAANARIRALADTAREHGPWPATPDVHPTE